MARVRTPTAATRTAAYEFTDEAQSPAGAKVSVLTPKAGRSARRDAAPPTMLVDGTVQEVLEGYGLAHVLGADGKLYGVNRHTPGVDFDRLREGASIRCKVTAKFSRVLHAELVG